MFIKTLNKMGYMMSQPEYYSKEFIEYTGTIPFPVLEIGAAYGVVTKHVVRKNKNVYVNDLSPEHLEVFLSDLPDHLRANVNLCPGAFPESCNFPDEFFGGILAGRVLHLLPPDELKKSIDYIYRLLKKGGKFFFIADTPFLGILKSYFPIYEERQKSNSLWPGFIDDTAKYVGGRIAEIPKQVNFLDFETTKRIFDSSLFHIEEISYINQKHFPDDVRLDGRESIGVRAVKN